MKIVKTIMVETNEKLDVSEIALLSIEEYQSAKQYIPRINNWWWLRSPGFSTYSAASVYPDGSVFIDGDEVCYDEVVRPALRIKNLDSLNLSPGDKVFDFAGRNWTVISDTLILCDTGIGRYCFHQHWNVDDANVYEKSDVKKYIEEWWENNK